MKSEPEDRGLSAAAGIHCHAGLSRPNSERFLRASLGEATHELLAQRSAMLLGRWCPERYQAAARRVLQLRRKIRRLEARLGVSAR